MVEIPIARAVQPTLGNVLQPLAVREPTPLLALHAPTIEHKVEDIEKMLKASQLGFHEAMMKQIQSMSEQMTLMVKNQTMNPPTPVESGRCASGLWSVDQS